MKLWKSSLLIMGLSALVLSSMTATAETISDPTGDVWHFDWNGGIYGFEHVSKPDVDITEVSYTVSGEQVTLTLKIAGTVSNSELIHYYAYVNTSDSTYWISWIEGEGFGMAMNEEAMQMDMTPEVTASGNTVTAVFDIVGTFSSGIELWGWAAEYSFAGDVTEDYWQDWAPNENDPYYGQDSGDSGDSGDSNPPPPTGTPGFETIAVIGAIAVALIILRKRK